MLCCYVCWVSSKVLRDPRLVVCDVCLHCFVAPSYFFISSCYSCCVVLVLLDRFNWGKKITDIIIPERRQDIWHLGFSNVIFLAANKKAEIPFTSSVHWRHKSECSPIYISKTLQKKNLNLKLSTWLGINWITNLFFFLLNLGKLILLIAVASLGTSTPGLNNWIFC